MTSGDIAVDYFMKYLQVATPLNCPTQHSFTTTCNTNDENMNGRGSRNSNRRRQDNYICYIAGIFSPTARALIGYFEVT